MYTIQLLLLVLLLQIVHGHTSKRDFFSSTADLEILIESEQILMNKLKQFLSNEAKMLEDLKSQILDYKKIFKLDTNDTITHFDNPINAFLIMKILTTDLKKMENFIGRNLEKELTQLIGNVTLPIKNDLTGAAIGIKRIQDTYKLDTSNMANGNINGIKFNTTMSANECYTLGVEFNNISVFDHSIRWLEESLRKAEPKDFKLKFKILKTMVDSFNESGDPFSSQKAMNQLLDITLNDVENELEYEEEIKESFLKQSESNKIKFSEVETMPYEHLCRNEVTVSHKQNAKLHCKYQRNNFFLKIAPLKLEEIYLDPYIVIYHNVIFDSEIEVLKDISKEMLENGLIEDEDKATQVLRSNVRSSKVAWLLEFMVDPLVNLGYRIADMTGLNVGNADPLQVVNYGIGGHYVPHVDFFSNPHPLGNRLATVLLYMNDVIQGGATVFPYIEEVVEAKKGRAVVWYNVFKSGDGDFRTWHASCPVLIGTKWVCNKWIREKYQEFLRPCELTSDYVPGFGN